MFENLPTPRIEFGPIWSGLGPGCTTGSAHHVYRLPNNYGLSVVRAAECDGGIDGQWEAAVILFEGPGSTDYERVDLAADSEVVDEAQLAGLLAAVARRRRVEVAR